MLWIERVPSVRCQVDEHGGQYHRVEGGRDEVGDTETDVEHIGGHGAEDAHHTTANQ